MYKKKAQSSLEFLMIFGIGFSIILVFSGLFFGYFNEEKNSLDSKHLENLGNKIIQSIEKVYFLGSGNRVTLNTNFPSGIRDFEIYHMNNITVDSKKISYDYINITLENEISQIYTTNELYVRFNCKDCYHNLTTNISYLNDSSFLTAGNKKIRIENVGDYVEISFVR